MSRVWEGSEVGFNIRFIISAGQNGTVAILALKLKVDPKSNVPALTAQCIVLGFHTVVVRWKGSFSSEGLLVRDEGGMKPECRKAVGHDTSGRGNPPKRKVP